MTINGEEQIALRPSGVRLTFQEIILLITLVVPVLVAIGVNLSMLNANREALIEIRKDTSRSLTEIKKDTERAIRHQVVNEIIIDAHSDAINMLQEKNHMPVTRYMRATEQR